MTAVSQNCDVAVIGAGVVGLACAFRLQEQGNSVVIFDRAAPGRGCSFGNVGVIAADTVEPLASPATLRLAPVYLASRHAPLSVRPRYALKALPWLTRFAWAARPSQYARGVAALRAIQAHSLPAWQRLVADADCKQLLHCRGQLLVSESSQGMGALGTRQKELRETGITAEIFSRHEIDAFAPGLGNQVVGGLYFPDNAHVSDPFRVSQALLKAALARGARLQKADVSRLSAEPDGSFELSDGARSWRAGRILISAGAWSAPLARQLGDRLPLDTERGYQLTFANNNNELRLPVASLERHTFMTPMSCGLRMTGFVEFGGLQLEPDAAKFEKLHEHMQSLLPGLAHATSSEWMGHRPSLPDHLPVISRSKRHPRVLLAFGHQHLGLTLAGITAELVGALANERAPAIDLTAFDAARFN